MKLLYKGFYKSEEQLPKGALPANAVKFIEPDNFNQFFTKAALFIIPSVLAIMLLMYLSYLLHGALVFDITWIGIALYFLTLLPHEILHALCFGKNAEVELYIASMALFVTSTQPISKARFIFLSLFPSLLFGWLPMLIWVILPHNEIYSNHLFTFATLSIVTGIGDYLNVFNALRQAPNGSICQLSGFHSYWYMPETELRS